MNSKKKILAVSAVVVIMVAAVWMYGKYQLFKDVQVLTPEQMSVKYRE
ncbi:hypothetical protein [Chryseobacterium sp.]|nr:hypothetical protein [Chryseobacterium sp.]